jgi:hypothetical protein
MPQINLDRILAQLSKRVQNKDYGLFVTEFAAFSQNSRLKRQQIPIQSKERLTSIISSVANNLSDFQLARTMRNMVECGYTLIDNSEKALLNDLKTQFLCKETSLRGISMFFTALNKLHFSWKEDNDNDEKDALVHLVEKASTEKMTPRQYSELMAAIVGIGIPWNSLSVSSQENLIKKMTGLRNKTDLQSAVIFLLAFSSFEDMNLQQLSKPLVAAFLKLTEESLQLLIHETDMETTGKQVISILFL